ncbi:hypothetical protein ANCDUO_17045, partial [Ancylostoma duodenale]
MFRCRKYVIIPDISTIPPDQCITTHSPLANGFVTTENNLDYTSTKGTSTILQHGVEYTTGVTTSSVLSTSVRNKNGQQSTELPRSTQIIDTSQQSGYVYSYTTSNTLSSAEPVPTSPSMTSSVSKTYAMSDIPTSSSALDTTLYSITTPLRTVDHESSLASQAPSSEGLLGSTSTVSSSYYPVHGGTKLDSTSSNPTAYSQNAELLSSESPSQGTSYQYPSNYKSTTSEITGGSETTLTEDVHPSIAVTTELSDSALPQVFTSSYSATVESSEAVVTKLSTSDSSSTPKTKETSLTRTITTSTAAAMKSSDATLLKKYTSIPSAKMESSKPTLSKLFTSHSSPTAKSSGVTLNGKTTGSSTAILDSRSTTVSMKHTSSSSAKVESNEATTPKVFASDSSTTANTSRITPNGKTTAISAAISGSDVSISPMMHTSRSSADVKSSEAILPEWSTSDSFLHQRQVKAMLTKKTTSTSVVLSLQLNRTIRKYPIMSNTPSTVEPNETTFRNSVMSSSSTTANLNETTPAKRITSSIITTPESDGTTMIEISTLNSNAYWEAYSSETMFSYDMKQSSDGELSHSINKTPAKEALESTSTSINSVVVEREDGSKVYSSKGTLQTLSTQGLNLLWNASTREVSVSHTYEERTSHPEGDRATPNESSAYMKGSAHTSNSEMNIGALQTTAGGVELTSYPDNVNAWMSTDAKTKQEEIETTHHASFSYSR